MEIIIKNKKFNLDNANSFKKRFLGLMKKKHIERGLFLPKTRSIHTFFMKVNIDIIMINKKNEVVLFIRNLGKNKIIIKKEAYHTIELPANSIKELAIGTKIIIE